MNSIFYGDIWRVIFGFLFHEEENSIQYWIKLRSISSSLKEIADSLIVFPLERGSSLLIEAAKGGNEEKVKFLLRRSFGIDPSHKDSLSFIKAAENGHLHVVKILMDDGRVDVTARECAGFRYAAQFGKKEVVDYLIKFPQIDPTLNGNSSILFSAENGHLGVVKVLVESGRVSLEGAISHAVKGKRLDIVKWLSDETDLDPNEGLSGIPICSSEDYCWEVIEILNKNPKWDYGHNNFKSLEIAIRLKEPKLLSLILNDQRINPQTLTIDILSEAIQRNWDDGFDILMKDGRFVPIADHLVSATTRDKYHMVSVLLKDGRIDPVRVYQDIPERRIGKKSKDLYLKDERIISWMKERT